MAVQYGIVPVITHPNLRTFEKAVWTTLCQFARWQKKNNGEPIRSIPGSCFPSLKIIAGYSCMSEKTALRTIKILQKAGFVQVIPRYNDKGGQQSNGYELFPKGDAPASGIEGPSCGEKNPL